MGILVRAVALVLLFSNAAGAASLYVSASVGDDANPCTTASSPCGTLGRALAVAVSGDSVLLAPGTYGGGTSVANGGDIEITGGWDDGVSDANGATVIEPGHHRGLAFLYDGANTGSVALRNLTIQKARFLNKAAYKTNAYDSPDSYGGGLLVSASGNASVDIVIDRVVFEKNRGTIGGGAALWASDDATMTVTITDSRFSKNRAITGGGLVIRNDDASMPIVDVERTVFEKNTGWIGGLLLDMGHESAVSSSALLSGLRFEKNNGGALDIYLHGGELDVQIENSVFLKNMSSNGATAVYAIAGPSYQEGVAGHLRTTSVHNSVSHNRGRVAAYVAYAGNFGFHPAQHEFVSRNDIIYGNAGGDVAGGSDFGAPVTVTRQNGIQGPALPVSGTVAIIDDNIANVDPRFEHADSDIHLRADSPAIDAVSCSASPLTDFEGDARPQGSQCDIGADEYVP